MIGSKETILAQKDVVIKRIKSLTSVPRQAVSLGVFFAMGIGFLLIIWVPSIIEAVVFYVFQSRDMARTTQLLAGKPIFFGPEMTGGGNLPGPFYYFLLSIPQLFSPMWTIAWYWLVALYAIIAAVCGTYFRNLFSMSQGILLIAHFALAWTVLRNLVTFLNVSYGFPFAALTLVCICVRYSSRDQIWRNRSFVAACFMSSLSIQLHLSLICFFISLMALQIFGHQLNLGRVSHRTFWFGILAFTLPIGPHLIWLLLKSRGISLGQEDFYSGSSTKAFSSLMLMTDYFRALPRDDFLYGIVARTLNVIPISLLLIAVTVGLCREAAHKAGQAPLIRALTFCSFVSFIPFSYWYIVDIGGRYTIPFFLSMMFLTIVMYEQMLRTPQRLRLYNILGSATLLASVIYGLYSNIPPANLTRLAVTAIALPVCGALLADRKFRNRSSGVILSFIITLGLAFAQRVLANTKIFNVTNRGRSMPSYSEWKRIWGHVYLSTAWTYDEAIHRTYFINHHLEQEASFVYNEILRSGMQPKVLFPSPDGYIVSITLKPKHQTRNDILSWILKQNLQREVKEGLRSGDLVIGESQSNNRLIIPYWVRNRASLPQHFHNFGAGYIQDPDEALLANLNLREGVFALGSGRILFKWNECPDAHPFCSTGAIVILKQTLETTVEVSVKVIGATLSQVSPWISPNWTQQWIEPYIELECGKNTHHLSIASSVGYGRENATSHSHILLWGNNSFVAPFKRNFSVRCMPTRLSLGRKGSAVETLSQIKTLPGKSLSTTLNWPN
jgi:hypothetical protein